jgi:hypothetical protein
MSRYFGRAAILCALLSQGFALPFCRADSYDDAHAKFFATNPSGLSLTLQMDRSAFYMGERLRVALEFRNTSAISYHIETRGYDRSGRLDDPRFCVEGPEHGFTDPLGVYFATFGGIGGGLGGYENLPPQGRFSMSFDLNEWVRFDLPGRYRVYCRTWRADPNDRVLNPVPLCSPILTFEILGPNRGWTASKVQSAVDKLRSPDNQVRREGARDLRFLAVPRAMAPLAALLDDDRLRGEALFGLVGSRDSSRARDALLQRLRRPSTVITHNYLNALAIVSAWPETPVLSVDSNDTEALRQQYERLHRVQEAALKPLLAELAAAVPHKKGRAQAMASLVLLERGVDSPPLRQTLAQVFRDLTSEEQCDVLEDRWEQVRCPAFQTTFERILSEPEVYEHYYFGGIRTFAVYRYLDLQPQKARDLILRDIRRPHPLFGGRAFMSLPDKALPELDEIFLANLKERDRDYDKLPLLIERYATQRILPDVIALYRKDAERWSGEIISGCVLRYWIKHDPEAGLAAVRRAVLCRRSVQSYKGILSDVLSPYYSPEAEDLALSFLDDTDGDVVRDVFRLFEKHGSPAIANPLLMLLGNLGDESFLWTTDSSNSPLRYGVISCLTRKRDWQLTNDQKKTLYSLLQSNEERAGFHRRFPEMAEELRR